MRPSRSQWLRPNATAFRMLTGVDRLASQTARYDSAVSHRAIVRASKRTGQRRRCKTRCEKRRRSASISNSNRPKTESWRNKTRTKSRPTRCGRNSEHFLSTLENYALRLALGDGTR